MQKWSWINKNVNGIIKKNEWRSVTKVTRKFHSHEWALNKKKRRNTMGSLKVFPGRNGKPAERGDWAMFVGRFGCVRSQASNDNVTVRNDEIHSTLHSGPRS